MSAFATDPVLIRQRIEASNGRAGPLELEVPHFPFDVLPRVVRRYVEDGVAALNVPADFIAWPTVGFSAGVIGNTRSLRVRSGWHEYANPWVAIIGAPGSGKSPAVDYAMKPLAALQAAALEQFKEQVKRWEGDTAAAKADKLTPPEKPALNHYFTTDATMEALAVMLNRSPGVVLLRDELSGWIKSFDQYRKGADRQNWLSLWASAPLKVDRKSSETIYIGRPCAPVVGGIQPDLLSDLAEEANRRDGFIDRFLFAWPVAKPMRWTEADLDGSSERAICDLFQRLRCSDPPVGGYVSRLGPTAKRAFALWHDDNAGIMEAIGDMGLATGFYAKYPSQLARIVLVLHALEYPDEPGRDVDRETVEAGIELVEYLRKHLARVLAMFPLVVSNTSERSAGLSARIIRILNREDLRNPGGWSARTDIHRGLGGNVAAADLAVTLEVLVSEGRVDHQTIVTGARPREEYRIAPMKNEDMKFSTNGHSGGDSSYLHIFDRDTEEARI